MTTPSGPLPLNPDGTIPFAVDREGRVISVALRTDGVGVEQVGIFGASSGRSSTLAALVLPGVYAGIETVWYVDGARGANAPHLAGECDWWAVSGPSDWEAVISAAHAVMQARQEADRIDPNPILTVCVDEAAYVAKTISDDIAGKLMQICRSGRRFGVRVVQSSRDSFIGGREARTLAASAGSLIHHGDSAITASRMVRPATQTQGLPFPPRVPGWVGILRRGRVVTTAARVRYADPDTVRAALTAVTPRPLAGEDLIAAGPAYKTRITGTAIAARHHNKRPNGTQEGEAR